MALLHTSLFAKNDALLDDDLNPKDFKPPAGMATGLARRSFASDPRGKDAEEFPDDLLIPEDDIKKMLAEQVGQNASLFELRERSNGELDSLNQTNHSLCWAFSSTKSAMYLEAISGHPVKKKSPWYVAGMIKGWADQGGWGEASSEFIHDFGAPLYDLCPAYSKKYATAEAKADAAKRKILKFYVGHGDKEKRCHQAISAFLRGRAPVYDLNWMGHSMSGCRLVSFTSFTKLEVDTDNSWGMTSGVKGLYRLKDSKAMPDDMVVPWTITASE